MLSLVALILAWVCIIQGLIILALTEVYKPRTPPWRRWGLSLVSFLKTLFLWSKNLLIIVYRPVILMLSVRQQRADEGTHGNVPL